MYKFGILGMILLLVIILFIQYQSVEGFAVPSGSAALNWQCIPDTVQADGKNVPVALTPEGAVKCMSTDAKNCLWDISCNSKLTTPANTIKPVVCTNYSNKNGWCYKGLQKLQSTLPKPTLATNWQCLDSGKAPNGNNVPMALTSTGDVACMATDGLNCLWDVSCNSKLSTPSNTIRPLVCGDDSKAKWGNTGYDTTSHWCYRVKENFKALSKPTITKITAGDKEATVEFTVGLEGSSAISNYEYSTDGGSTFRALSPAKVTSPIKITNLENDKAYSIVLRAISNMGTSVASNALAIVPKAPAKEEPKMPEPKIPAKEEPKQTTTEVTKDSPKTQTQETATNIQEASNLVKDLKELVSSVKRMIYLNDSSEAKKTGKESGIATTTGEGAIKGADSITSVPAPTAIKPVVSTMPPNTACLQQGSEMITSNCPDMSQYIRKDQIPCWNCNVDY